MEVIVVVVVIVPREIDQHLSNKILKSILISRRNKLIKNLWKRRIQIKNESANRRLLAVTATASNRVLTVTVSANKRLLAVTVNTNVGYWQLHKKYFKKKASIKNTNL